MNREIKFRAWDKKNKFFHENIENDRGIYGDGTLRDYLDDENFIVIQYTGLKDKNGKEIYKGDIVEFNGEIEISQTNTKWTSEVVFKRGSFVVRVFKNYEEDFVARKQDNPFRYTNLGCWNTQHIEVVGNIYENLKLLNK